MLLSFQMFEGCPSIIAGCHFWKIHLWHSGSLHYEGLVVPGVPFCSCASLLYRKFSLKWANIRHSLLPRASPPHWSVWVSLWTSLLEYLWSGCLDCRHQRCAEVAFGELLMVLGEQAALLTAESPELFIGPGQQIGAPLLWLCCKQGPGVQAWLWLLSCHGEVSWAALLMILNPSTAPANSVSCRFS